MGAVLQESRNSEELHTGSPPLPLLFFGFFFLSIVTLGSFCRKMAKWNLESQIFSNKPEGRD